MVYRTNKDIETNAFGIHGLPSPAWTLPKGTKVKIIKGLSGTTGDGFVVCDISLLMRLSGNKYDPAYRYFVVNDSDVDEVEA